MTTYYIKIDYKIDILWQTACMVVDLIMADHFDSLYYSNIKYVIVMVTRFSK